MEYDRSMHFRRLDVRGCLLVAASAVLPMACEPSYAPRRTIDLRPRVLEVTDQHGGTRRIALHHEDHWYQSFGVSIEVIDPDDGLRITQLTTAPWGEIAPISDMIVTSGGELVVVHALDRVVRYDLRNPRRPMEIGQLSADELGIEPLFAADDRGRVWISGRGGATPLDDPGTVLLGGLDDDTAVGRVVGTDEGLAATMGRRILAVEDGRYLGAASELRAMPAGLAEDRGIPGSFVFVLRNAEASTVGLMGPNLREIDRKVFRGPVRSARILGDRLWAVFAEEIVTWPVEDGGRLGQPIFIAVKGAMDVAMVEPNRYAVGGTFGRALYRLHADNGGDADEFFAVERSPGRLEAAATDGRRVLAGGNEGNWLYRIGGDVELTDRALRNNTPPKIDVTTSWGEARLEEEGRVLRMDAIQAEPFEWTPPHRGKAYVLETADDRVFVGHDFGVDCFEYRDGAVQRVGGVVFEGPVAWLFRPRVGDEVAFVSVFGGLGTLEVVPDPDADPDLVRRVRPEEAEEIEAQMRGGDG